MMLFISFLLSLIVLQTPTDGIAVMSIDLGTEFMKIAVVAPGMPMDVALGSDSKRKTSTAISFYDGGRQFGSDALSLANRVPHLVYQSIPAILGKHLDHPTVKLFQERYPYHNISYNVTNDQLTFHHPDGMDFTVQELVAMLLEYAQEIAEHHSGHKIQSCVITVPNFFGQTERRSLRNAANLAGLTLLQLINANTAVALNFGAFRRTEFNTTARHYMFYDIGSMSTTAVITSFYVGKNRESGTVSEDPMLNVVGVGFDPMLGTSTFIYTLRDFLAVKFNEKKKLSKDDVRWNARSMSKLTTEAGRVFRILSANTDAIVQIENLADNEDFQLRITRSDLESLCEQHFKRLEKPFTDALQSSKLDIADIEEVVIMGGGTRIPRVQEVLMKLAQRSELGKGINSDEAAVLGAAYRAAFHTPGLRVLPFAIRDYNPYPIGVDFARALSAEINDSTDQSVRRVLFPRGNPFPQKRAITFNRHVSDFTFYVNYVDLSPSETIYLGTQNLSSTHTSGVQEAIARYPKAEMRGVKAHFSLDFSGILTLTSTDCIFHPIYVEPAEEVEPNADNQSTFQKLGNKISDFFGVGSTGDEGKLNDTDSSANASDTRSPANGTTTPEGSAEQNATKIVTPPPSPTSSKHDPNDSTTADVGQKKNVTKPPPFSEPVKFTLTQLDVTEPLKEHFQESVSKLNRLRQDKIDRQNLEKAMNDLESALFSSREQLESSGFIKHSTDHERSSLDTIISQILNWYDEQDRSTTKEAYEDKLSELRLYLIPIELRLSEAKQREPILDAIHKQLKYADEFLPQLHTVMRVFEGLEAEADQQNITDASDSATSATETETPPVNASDSSNSSQPESTSKPKPLSNPWFTKSDVDSLGKLIQESKIWLSNTEATFRELSPTERPPILVSEIQKVYDNLSRDLGYLSRRMQLLRTETERLMKSQQAASTPGGVQKEETKDAPTQSSTDTKEEPAGEKVTFGGEDESATAEPTTPRTDL